MSEEKKLAAEINRLDREIKALQARRHELAVRLAPLLCPIKVGDRIQYVRGRQAGQTWEITAVSPGWDPTDYRLFARKVLKGGGLGKLNHRLWEWDVKEMKRVEP